MIASLKETPFGHLAKAVYYQLYRLAILARCRASDLRERPSTTPPALLRFRVSGAISAAEFVRVGQGVAQALIENLRAAGRPLQPRDRILDFGCGCARTLLWGIKYWQEAEWHGVDVDSEAIEWCRRNIPDAKFVANSFRPPLPYPDRHFDVIYSVSVFTHLDEQLQDEWLAELHRLTKPGGAVVISVHGLNATSVLTEPQLASLQRDGILHLRSTKLSGLTPDWYQTTWHLPLYIEERLGRLFDSIAYISRPGHLQDFVFCKRNLTEP